MDIPDLHPWDVTYKEAVEIQERLRDRVILKGLGKRIKHIAGLDVSYAKRADTVWAGAVVLDFSGLAKTEERWSQKRVFFLTSQVS